MLKAGRNLKALYPKLLHVTYLAHVVNLVAEEVRGHYPEVDQLVRAMKAVFRKSPTRIQKFGKMFPGLPLPPRPVLTRWGTWLEAVEYYAQNFNSVKAVIESIDPNEAKCVEQAQKLLKDNAVRRDLCFISSSFTFLRITLQDLQADGLSIAQTLELIGFAKDKLEQLKGDTAKAVSAKFGSTLTKNKDLREIEVISRILDGEEAEIEGLLETFDPARISSFKYAPLTTVPTERSFSVHKFLLSDRRRRLTADNLEMEVVVHFEMLE